jgi:2-polyprenyl-6-methoxyphenol hydroxylase-like FAD-dependent oxidoreductase
MGRERRKSAFTFPFSGFVKLHGCNDERFRQETFMRHTDVAIVGGGLAGSTAAAMLGRAGYDAVLIDPHPVYPSDFRCEKLDSSQVRLLHKTGLADDVLRVATPDLEVWIARFGQLVEKRPNSQFDILYDALVNGVRAEIRPSISSIQAKATAIATSPDRQRVTLSTGEEISARLIVLANGLNIGLRHTLGMTRDVVSPCHSISIGFDVKPVGRSSFGFRALTSYPERISDRMAYVTFFPIGTTMRANLFVYRDMHDPWLRQMRSTPEEALLTLQPSLRQFLGDFEVPQPVKIRPVDLYVTNGHRQAGIVLVGDAFATSCPAAGTGCNKVFTDVERLCNVHIPRWLTAPGMDADKIANFYDDKVKVDCDAASAAKAFYLRSLSTESGLTWQARRWGRFIVRFGMGSVRQARGRLPSALDRKAASF